MNNEAHNQDKKRQNNEIKKKLTKDSDPTEEEEIEGIWKFQLRFMFSICLILMMIALLTTIYKTQAEQSMFFARAIIGLFTLTLLSCSYVTLIIVSIAFKNKKDTEGSRTLVNKIVESLNTNLQDTKFKIPFKCKVLFVLEISLALAFLVAITTSTL